MNSLFSFDFESLFTVYSLYNLQDGDLKWVVYRFIFSTERHLLTTVGRAKIYKGGISA